MTREIASRYLSAQQLEVLQQALDQDAAAHANEMRREEVRRAALAAKAASSDSGAPSVQGKNPGSMAVARFDFQQHLQPGYQSARTAQLAAEDRKYWTERVEMLLLGFPPELMDRLIEARSELRYHHEQQRLACDAAADCDSSALQSEQRGALNAETERVLGRERFDAFTRANTLDSYEYYFVHNLRSRLGPGHGLTDEAARLLAQAFAAERARLEQEARQRGEEISNGPSMLHAAVPRGAPDQGALQLASATAYSKRLRAIAGQRLDAEQMRVFNAAQDEGIAYFKARVQDR